MSKTVFGPWQPSQTGSGRRGRYITKDGVRYFQWEDEDKVRRLDPPPTERSQPRHNPPPADLRYNRNLNDRQEEQSQQPGPVSYAVVSRHHGPNQGPAYANTQDYGIARVQSSPAAAFRLFPRDNVEQPINLATSAPTQDTYPYTNIAGVGSRSGSNDRRGLGRPTSYIRQRGGEEVEYRVGRGSVSLQPFSESPRADYATLNKSSTTHLSRLGFEFTQLPYADYASCEEFVAKNPTILQDDPNSFLHEALRLEKEGRSSQARVNVQRAILLRQCRKTSHNGRRDFFSGLKRKDPNILGAFVDDFDKTMKEVKRTAQTEPENNNAPDIRAHGPDRPYRGSTDTTLSSGMQTMNLGHQTNTPEAGLQRQNSAALYGVSQPGPVPSPVEEDSVVSTVGAPSIEPEIRGTEKECEDLDPRYFKRSDAKKFFVVGRVFALLWHENAGECKTGREGYIDHTTEGRFGSRVFSHIRRMAVVIERKGYCVCIPIHTYGGQGILKHGLDLRERQAHSIIHASDTGPAGQKEELAVLVKKPIAVTMANKEQKLDKSSRINFAKPHTVEWNVKVMNVGKVTPDSLPAFKSYFRKETVDNIDNTPAYMATSC